MKAQQFQDSSNFGGMTKAELDDSLAILCISHRRPLFDVPMSYCLVTASGDVGHNSVILSDDALGPVFDGSFLSEYSQHFSVANLRRDLLPTGGSTYLFQYRKFLSFKKTPILASNASWVHIARPHQAPELFPTLDELKHQQGTILIGQVIKPRRSLCAAYGDTHLVEDFCSFVAALREVQGFTRNRIKRFINDGFMLPSPALCAIPNLLHLDLMKILQSTWQVFHEGFYIQREGYQRRVGGFLLERLHGHLLLEYIRHKRCDYKLLHQITVSDQDTMKPTI